jgi:hypothetical protein
LHYAGLYPILADDNEWYDRMTTEAILFMTLGWGVAAGILGFCIYKVIQSNHSPGDTPPE